MEKANHVISKRFDVFEIYKYLNKVKVITKLLDTNQRFLLHNMDLPILTNNTSISEENITNKLNEIDEEAKKSIEEINEHKFIELDFKHYIANKIQDLKVSELDLYLLSRTNKEIKQKMLDELKGIVVV